MDTYVSFRTEIKYTFVLLCVKSPQSQTSHRNHAKHQQEPSLSLSFKEKKEEGFNDIYYNKEKLKLRILAQW